MADKNKMTIYITLSLLLIVVVMFIYLSFALYHQRQQGISFRENYGRLKVGLSKEEIRTAWGTPEYIIDCASGRELWSYKDEGHPIHFVDKITFSEKLSERKMPATGEVVSLEEMDRYSSYSNAELLFDKEGKLEAYKQIGEETTFHTRYGDMAVLGWKDYYDFLNEPNQCQDGNLQEVKHAED